MSRIYQNIKKVSLKLAALLLAILPLANIAPASAEELVDTPWGPDRKMFSWDDPAPYATFNSIIDNPQIGDERNFVRIREVADGNKFGDEVTLEVGKTYEVYIYYHNNADAHDVGKTAIGIADGAAVQSSFPATVMKGEKATVTGKIFASDTDPLAVWDGAYMTATEDMYLRYVPGTAIIHNGGQLNGQSIGPDYLFGDGALLGYNQFSGILPGCNEYAGYITYQIFADAPKFNIEKTIVSDTDTFKPGDEITFKVRYENVGTMDQLNVVVRDTLPAGLTYVEGSTILYNNNFTEGKPVNDDIINENGMNIGDYAGGSGWAEVVYKARVNDDVDCNIELTNSVIVSTTDGNKTAGVTIKVTRDDCTPAPTPEEDCNTNPNLPGCDLPKEIVQTGPLQIVMAVLVILGIGAGGFYLYRTRRTLKTVESTVTGTSNSNINPFDEPTKPTEPTNEPINPITPAGPSTSETPETPEQPTEPEVPARPETPSKPVAPASFSAPTNPITPKGSETPESPKPEDPQTPETPPEN